MGRSRGRLTSKIDAEGRPVTLHLTAGQVHDSQGAETLIEGIDEGAILLGDKGYDSNAIRAKAAERKVWANIPGYSPSSSLLRSTQRASQRRNFIPAQPDYPTASVREFVSGPYTGSR